MTNKETWDEVWKDSRTVDPSRLVEEIGREEKSFRCQHILHFMKALGFNLSGLSVIEVGCGSSIYGCIMARPGAVVMALDQSEKALARTEERANAIGVEVKTVRAEALEFGKIWRGTFDMAMSFGTVEHFRAPLREQMCKVHWDLVKPGGVVVISVPNLLFLPHEILKWILMLRGKWFLGYEGSFTPWELKRVGWHLGLGHLDFHGTDVIDDLLKYWGIVTSTRTWRQLFPWWKPNPNRSKSSIGTYQPPGRLRSLVNRYLGHEITLLGVKGN
jgi:2-polyprenyl-3-methyl-5-hydroxy-6-metoxy-1,4-benzoquinol methylase